MKSKVKPCTMEHSSVACSMTGGLVGADDLMMVDDNSSNWDVEEEEKFVKN